MSTVSFTDVRKEYDGSIVAVDGVSLDIEDGEFVSIVGPSGSGKSTLLRMLAGLEGVSDGEISIRERVVNDVPPQERGIAMVFQNYALYPHMSVRKNMSYGLKLTSDLADDEIDRRVEEAAEMMGIEELLDKRPGNLSGGQQQRVATGRAIVRDPEAFLMDEPLSNLDAKLKIHMRTELQRIQEELNTTTIYVTHDQEEAMTMSDRIVVLADGKLQQVGTPDEVYHQPTNQFVADFIGSPSMNFFGVELRDGALVGAEFTYPLSETFVQNLEAVDGDTLTLGVRPEYIMLDEEGSNNSIRATVDVVEPVGSDNYIYLHIGEDECILRTQSGVRPSAGSVVNISFDESSLHLFDAKTNESVFERRAEYLPASD
ncbi:ABC transporter ATP-binding protein [Haladaptatus pallidirubidus]|uniref:ABC-type D-xylose/L-arabinose transporter n=1 Tax=Haladaptatus pallidirubidus TaxID=1008152 RepID=A0AAV3UJ62_9EURY|nr:sn-glycerol-3-phosphate ABC transporter ATP-binding protein UgpC [Haladaptatus pallidirubidus]